MCLPFEHRYHLVPVFIFFLLKLHVSFSLIKSQVAGFCQLISVNITQTLHTNTAVFLVKDATVADSPLVTAGGGSFFKVINKVPTCINAFVYRSKNAGEELASGR